MGVVGDGSTLWLPEMWFVLPFHRVNCQILASCFICHDVARFLELVARRDVSGKPRLRMLRTGRPPTTNDLSLLSFSPRLRLLPRLPGARAAPRLHTPQGDSVLAVAPPSPPRRPAVAPLSTQHAQQDLASSFHPRLDRSRRASHLVVLVDSAASCASCNPGKAQELRQAIALAVAPRKKVVGLGGRLGGRDTSDMHDWLA